MKRIRFFAYIILLTALISFDMAAAPLSKSLLETKKALITLLFFDSQKTWEPIQPQNHFYKARQKTYKNSLLYAAVCNNNKTRHYHGYKGKN